MYQQHFGMHTDPFPLSPKLAFVFPSRAFGETMAHLVYGIEQAEDIILITGGIGTGKTLAVNNLLAQIHRVLEPVVINVTRLTFAELIKTVLLELGETVAVTADTPDLLQQLKRVLHARRREGRKVLLIVDEAQHLSVETLESLRLLTNLSTPEEQCLQLVLVGQHALEESIGRRELAQLSQRIRVRYRIEPLSRQEVEAYLDHRVRIAGCSRHLFRPGAIDRIYDLSQGIPRVVNILASRALLAAFVAGKSMIEPSHVRAEDLPPVTDAPDDTAFSAPRAGAGEDRLGAAETTDSNRPAPNRPQIKPSPPRQARERSPQPASEEDDGSAPILMWPPRGAEAKTRGKRWLAVALPIVVLLAALLFWQWPNLKAPRSSGNRPTVAPPTDRQGVSTPAVTPDGSLAVARVRPDTIATGADVPAAEPSGEGPTQQTPERVAAEPTSDDVRSRDVAEIKPEPARPAAPPAESRVNQPVVTPHPGDLVVHVGSYPDASRAEHLKQRLAAVGYVAYVTRDVGNGEPWFRVYTGPYASKDLADQARARITEAGVVAYTRLVTVGE